MAGKVITHTGLRYHQGSIVEVEVIDNGGQAIAHEG